MQTHASSRLVTKERVRAVQRCFDTPFKNDSFERVNLISHVRLRFVDVARRGLFDPFEITFHRLPRKSRLNQCLR